jgi:hypothetical protein
MMSGARCRGYEGYKEDGGRKEGRKPRGSTLEAFEAPVKSRSSS